MEDNRNDPDLSERIQKIVEVEKNIDDMMKCAKDCLFELGKDKQASKNKMEESAQSFKKLLSQIEVDLNAQLQYLSNVCVGSAHQGSTFASRQNIALAETTEALLHLKMKSIANDIQAADFRKEERMEPEDE